MNQTNMALNELKKLPLNKLVDRINKAPDFGYDEEVIELKRRGYTYTWGGHYPKQKLIIKKI